MKRVGGFEVAERLYAAPLDSDAVVLPAPMRVHNIEWVADGAAQFIQASLGRMLSVPSSGCTAAGQLLQGPY